MKERSPLGDFLQTRRSQLRPEDAGVPTYGDRRRVPGLRREELALLAGVSASYYTRLEQGQSPSASAEVLDALAGALRLDDSERRYLHDLAGAGRRPARPRKPAPERVTEATRQLLDVLGDTPAIVLGRRTDVLAWNPMGHALFAGHADADAPGRPGERPNMARLVFLDSHIRELYADWPGKARAVVGGLRLTAGQHPEDAALHALVGELSAKSGERRGKAWRAKSGSVNVLSGAPFGYRYVRKTPECGAFYEVAAHEAALVAEMFRRYADDGAAIADLAAGSPARAFPPAPARRSGTCR